ncbi:hypothetical protein GCM10028804_17800 [Larkinella terrae]
MSDDYLKTINFKPQTFLLITDGIEMAIIELLIHKKTVPNHGRPVEEREVDEG